MSLPNFHYRVNGDGSIDELIDPSSIVWGPPQSVPIKENLFVACKEVITFICDNCGAEASPSDKPILPTGWTDIVFSHTHTMENVQVCQICTDAIAKALAERRSNTGTEKKGATK